jgi:lactoylglutathione lyase
MKFNNVRLLVTNFAACFEFYKNKLGLEVSHGDENGPYASFNVGIPSGLTLFQSDLMAQVTNTVHLGKAGHSRDKFAIVIEVDDVDELYSELKGIVAFTNPPADMPAWGIRIAHLRDPEGNLLELYSGLKE